VKLSKTHLKGLIKEEMKRQRMEALNEAVVRLLELYPGSRLGSYLKQSIAKIWEADTLIQHALADAEDDEMWKSLTGIHKALEKLAYYFHDQVESFAKADVDVDVDNDAEPYTRRSPASGSTKPSGKSVPKAPVRNKR
jgi:hypothetical protein